MTVVLAATMFTACGSSKSGDDGDKTLIMGTNAEFPPYEYRENNEVIGIDAEIGKAIADKLGMDFKKIWLLIQLFLLFSQEKLAWVLQV